MGIPVLRFIRFIDLPRNDRGFWLRSTQRTVQRGKSVAGFMGRTYAEQSGEAPGNTTWTQTYMTEPGANIAPGSVMRDAYPLRLPSLHVDWGARLYGCITHDSSASIMSTGVMVPDHAGPGVLELLAAGAEKPVVEGEHDECRRPLADEQRRVILLGKFEPGGGEDRTDRQPIPCFFRNVVGDAEELLLCRVLACHEHVSLPEVIDT